MTNPLTSEYQIKGEVRRTLRGYGIETDFFVTKVGGIDHLAFTLDGRRCFVDTDRQIIVGGLGRSAHPLLPTLNAMCCAATAGH